MSVSCIRYIFINFSIVNPFNYKELDNVMKILKKTVTEYYDDVPRLTLEEFKKLIEAERIYNEELNRKKTLAKAPELLRKKKQIFMSKIQRH